MSKPYIILHKGNFNGSNPLIENHPSHIKDMLRRGFKCEIDVWFVDGFFYLGHDAPVYGVEECFLENDDLFCHAKNLPALYRMLNNSNIHCFFHQNDTCAITSQGMIWQSHYDNLTDRTIVVDTTDTPNYNANCYGLCVDYAPKIN